MDVVGSISAIILAIIVAVILYYFFKKAVALVINAIVGVIVLFLINILGFMSLVGRPDIPIDWITILISAIGGLPGVVIVVILHLIGVQL
jgi:hypothetical protein